MHRFSEKRSGIPVAKQRGVMRIVSYVILLVAAFLVGLMGTVAASQALVSAANATRAAQTAPKNVPALMPIAPAPPTIEC
jgi:hypothetical protein